MDGRYEPIAIEELADGVLQGYSAALNLHLRWEHGELRWHDPATGSHILTYEDQRAARMEAAARAEAAEAETTPTTRGLSHRPKRKARAALGAGSTAGNTICTAANVLGMA